METKAMPKNTTQEERLDVCFQAILGVLYLQWTKK